MGILIAIIGAVFAIFCVVIIHEFGHFLLARGMGVRVLKFSIGFGKPIWSKTTKKGTEFAIGWLPLGGYVRMLGEGDEAPPEDMKAYSYNNKTVLQRMAIVLAGPFMNFILAVLLYWILFLPGVEHIKPVIASVRPDSIAAHAGLRSMDQIVAVNKKRVKNWRDVILQMVTHIGDENGLVFTVIGPSKTRRNAILSLKGWKINEQKPQFLQALGIRPYRPKFPMVVGRVLMGSPAAKAGLEEGDHIISVNGKKYNDMINVVQFIRKNPDKSIQLVVLRKGKQKNLTIKTDSKRIQNKTEGYVGFTVVMPKWPSDMLELEKYSLLGAFKPAVQQTGSLIKLNGIVLGKMILGKMSIRSLGGPISIFQMAGQASQQNYRVYLSFLAFLSIALGFINLLPIPGLDGGHFLFQLIELVFRRPVPMHIQALCIRIGIIVLIVLILNATLNDLRRLFT